MSADRRPCVAVTGAAGRLGEWVRAALAARAVSCIALDRRGGTETPTCAWYADNLEQPGAVAHRLAGCSAVIHLAGAVPAVGTTPATYRTANVWTTAVVAEAAALAGIGRLVLASTSHVYGSAAMAAVHEDDALAPASPYARSKVAAEQVAFGWAEAGGAACLAARLGNLYGFLPADDTAVGRLVGQALRGEPLAVRTTADVRDFTHVGDAAEALVRLALLPTAIRSQPVNVSTGVGVSVGDVARTVRTHTGRPDAPLTIEAPHEPGTTLVMAIERLHTLLGTMPMRTIDEGVRHMMDTSSSRSPG